MPLSRAVLGATEVDVHAVSAASLRRQRGAEQCLRIVGRDLHQQRMVLRGHAPIGCEV